MTYREQSDVTATFARIAAALDAALEHLRSTDSSRDLQIDDRSNRSGFDWSGFGQPRWTYVFRRSWTNGAYRVTNEAEVSYQEPCSVGVSPNVEARWVTDVFAVGAAWSVSKATGTLPVTVLDLVDAGLEAVVKRLLSAASQQTPPEHAR